MSEERRCPSCDALVSADAQWCGQCFASLRDPAPPSDASSPGTTPSVAERRSPYWPCGVCGGENPLEVDVCRTCGTPFAHVMRAEPDRGGVDPDVAFRRSLVFPGLGHRAAGRGTDGFARGVLFAIVLLLAILTGVAASSVVTTLVFVVLLVAAVVVYVGSAVEARRLARGDGLLVSSRALMWVLVAIVFVSVGLLGFSVVTSLRK